MLNRKIGEMKLMKYLTSVAFLVPLSGCFMQRDLDLSTPWQWDPTVDISSLTHVVSYKAAGSSLSCSDKEALKKLYFSFHHLDKVSIRLGVSHFQETSPLSGQMGTRIHGLQHFLRGLGVPPSHITVLDKELLPEGNLNERGDSIVVIFDEYTAIPPRCPGWEQVMDGHVAPEGEVNFGCSNKNNFAYMAADPRVFDQGLRLGESDGARSALAVSDYRKDKIKPLKIQQVSSSTDNSISINTARQADVGGKD